MLNARRISKSYGGQVVLSVQDLSIAAHQTTVLIGPSGSGKSTLLRVLLGLIVPDIGTVMFDDMELTAGTAVTLRHRMGYVVQHGGLFPHLTAAANVGLLAGYLGWPRERIEQRLVELAELTQLPVEAVRRFPMQLSGGQRQRVSLMRALMLNPEVLLLDEPLGALDPMIRSELQADLKAIFTRLQKTVVLVTHDLAEAAHFGDRIVLLRDGRIVQIGSLADLVQNPATDFVRRFVTAQRHLHGGLEVNT